MMASPWTNDPAQVAAYNFFLTKGWSPAQAAGIVGGLRGETSNLNASQSHDNGIGLGIAGWNGQRLQALHSFAAQHGTDATDLRTQLEFVNYELNGPEANAGRALRSAQTPQDAGNAVLAYFRPKDWDVQGAHPERAAYASQLYGAMNGQGGQGAPSASPAANILADTPSAQQATNVSGLLGLLAPTTASKAAGPTQLAFNAPPAQALPAASSAPVVDFTKVGGPATYPEFKVGQPLPIIDAQGNQRMLHPVSYNPFEAMASNYPQENVG
jgi:hypothetical protein